MHPFVYVFAKRLQCEVSQIPDQEISLSSDLQGLQSGALVVVPKRCELEVGEDAMLHFEIGLDPHRRRGAGLVGRSGKIFAQSLRQGQAGTILKQHSGKALESEYWARGDFERQRLGQKAFEQFFTAFGQPLADRVLGSGELALQAEVECDQSETAAVGASGQT